MSIFTPFSSSATENNLISRFKIYSLTFGLVCIAFIIHILLVPIIGHDDSFLLFYSIIMVSAWVGGGYTGLFATAISSIFVFFSLVNNGEELSTGEIVHVILFFGEGVLISVLAYGLRIARSKTEKKLKDIEEFRRLALEETETGTWVNSVDTDFIFWDAQTRRIFGVGLDEPISIEKQFSIIHPDDRDRAQNVYERTINLNSTAPYNLETRIIWKDNSVHWVYTVGKIIYENQGGVKVPSRLIGLVTDITARKQIQQQSRDSKEKYHTLFNSIDQGFCICEMLVDDNGEPFDYRFLEVNYKFEDHTGLKDATGRTALELIPNLEKHWIEIYGKVALKGERHQFVQGSDVMGRWFDVQSFRFGDPYKRRFAILFKDISDRKQAEIRSQFLQMVTSKFSKAVTQQEVTDIVLEQSIGGVGAKGVKVIRLMPDDKTQLQVIGAVGYSEHFVEKWKTIPINHPNSPSAIAIRENRPLWLRSLQERINLSKENLDEMQFEAYAILPFNVDEGFIGAIGLGFSESREFTDADRTFLMTLTDYYAQTMRRAQLTEELRELATLEERQRLSRDLHDSVKQILFASTAIAESLPKLWQKNPQRAEQYTQDVINLNRAGLAEMQILLMEMRPETITKTPFKSLLENLGRAIRGHHEIEVDLNYDGPSDLYLPETAHVALYRLAQEALNNVSKHSQATVLDIACSYESDTCYLKIADNGKGFDAKRTSMGIGLNTMQERAEAIGAKLKIVSEEGNGTQVCVTWQAQKVVSSSV